MVFKNVLETFIGHKQVFKFYTTKIMNSVMLK